MSDQQDNAQKGRVNYYRGKALWHIQYSPKPIPTDKFDWDFWHDDYDGAPDAKDHRCGSAPSLFEAMEAIREIEKGL